MHIRLLFKLIFSVKSLSISNINANLVTRRNITRVPFASIRQFEKNNRNGKLLHCTYVIKLIIQHYIEITELYLFQIDIL